MKLNTWSLLLGTCILVCFLLSSCFNLNQRPQGQLSSDLPFTSVNEIQKYLNQFYQSRVRVGTKTVTNTALVFQPVGVGSAQGIAFGDLGSDNMAGEVVNTRLAGQTALSDAGMVTEYRLIRSVNYLLNNIENCKEPGKALDNCKGEALFFRALYHYRLLQKYGPATWLDAPLPPQQEEMRRARDSRVELTDHILADLKSATELLSPQNSNATMRVHKDVALALTSEVALFEATWERYHSQKKTPFHDPNATPEKITEYLHIAAQSAQQVIESGRWSIYTSNPLKAYGELFRAKDLSGNPEVLWWKKYDAANGIGHSVTRYLNEGGGMCGATASLVDDYLARDGHALQPHELLQLKRTYGKELSPEHRDPRLSQTICTPGQELKPGGAYTFTIPPLHVQGYKHNTTGYAILKHVEYDTDYQPAIDGEGKSQSPAIQIRYADVLLNYAEALAELDGPANATKIIEALRPLRERVGMPNVDFDKEYNTNPNYPFHQLDKYIQAVRRERRVETAIEGKRLYDILRWAAANVLIQGETPQGALFIGSDLPNNKAYHDPKTPLVYDQEKGNNLYLTGTPTDANRYILPLNPQTYPNGWGFQLNRDYLQPIPETIINQTEKMWTQNPGW